MIRKLRKLKPDPTAPNLTRAWKPDSPLKIGNASAFWGDSNDAPARLVRQAPDLDVLTLDYLAEVSMSILAKQRQREPSAGYARDFVEVVKSLAFLARGA